MRVRTAVIFMLLLLPSVTSAQRFRMPRIGRGPDRPAPLPPQVPTIARELAYRRLPLAIESYPMISHFQSSAAAEGAAAAWTSGGAGTRADYRLTRHLSATLDLTSSFLGGPALTQTVETGARLRPERSERRIYPFLDVRFGYMNSFDAYFMQTAFMDRSSPALPFGPGARYSHGVGGVAGAGVEYTLTRTISLTTAGSVMRTRMRAHGATVRTGTDRFSMTAYRYLIGLRYNPGRFIRTPATALPTSSAAR